MNKGMWAALGAYGLWGLFPIYWKWLQAVPAVQIIGHRIVWSLLSLGVVVLATRQGRAMIDSVRRPGVLRSYSVAAGLIGINWLVYVWGVHSDRIVETSLGYFISPMLSVVLGVVVLGERLRLWQWVPVALAGTGVVYLTLALGSPPWFALTLAVSFGVYGLVKKKAPLGAVSGLILETAILAPAALAYLVAVEATAQGAFLHSGPLTMLLLAGTGPVTAAPLLLFAAAAQRIPLTLVGIMMYIAPTLQFLIGVFAYDEPFTRHQFVGFSLVWAGLVVFSVEGWLASRSRRAVSTTKRREE